MWLNAILHFHEHKMIEFPFNLHHSALKRQKYCNKELLYKCQRGKIIYLAISLFKKAHEFQPNRQSECVLSPNNCTFFSNFQTCTVCMKSSARVKFTTYFKRIFANCRYKAQGGEGHTCFTYGRLFKFFNQFTDHLKHEPPTLLKDSVFPGPPRHHHTFKKLKKLRLNYLQLVHYLFFDGKGFQFLSIVEEKIFGVGCLLRNKNV